MGNGGGGGWDRDHEFGTVIYTIHPTKKRVDWGWCILSTCWHSCHAPSLILTLSLWLIDYCVERWIIGVNYQPSIQPACRVSTARNTTEQSTVQQEHNKKKTTYTQRAVYIPWAPRARSNGGSKLAWGSLSPYSAHNCRRSRCIGRTRREQFVSSI